MSDSERHKAVAEGVRGEMEAVGRRAPRCFPGSATLCGPEAPRDADGRTTSAVKKHHHKHNLKHRYELLETLGKGTYGKVKRAVERRTGREVAIKSIRKDKIEDEQDMVHIRREIEIQSSLRHPHIIAIYEVFENRDKIVIVMEYASKGELYDYLSERRRLSESEIRHFFRQIVSAVHHCHKNGIVHRDLKLENVLLDENFNIKIADFGLSNLYHRDKLLQTYCGSPLYASPEIINGRPYHGPEVDSWALGVLLYTLVYGTMPFDGGNHRHLVRQISSGEYREPAHSSDARGLIRWMLMVNPERRATVEDIANHWWVNWGWRSSVCDCGAQSNASSPLLARLLHWQNHNEPHSSTYQRHRKPRKENERAGSCHWREDGPGLKRPKGILKTKVEAMQHCLSKEETELRETVHSQEGNLASDPDQNFKENDGNREELSLADSSAAKMVSPSPKKGILKNSQQRESGYYSSPEHSESSELPEDSAVLSPTRLLQKRTAGKRGILKRNGRYATDRIVLSSGVSGDSGLSRSQSRPSSVSSGPIDTFCYTDSGLVPQLHLRSSLSAENLLPLVGLRGLQAVPSCPQGEQSHGVHVSSADDSSFSLLGDMDDVTQVYKQALDISSCLT
ncbi:NUAK family SNF1-like kinase 1-like [Scleropages formosus]|uniref:non-specific serine/threonine protein kinase n=1 Tax=Scleropages formosus TaxID=113540 RepID=A0A0N8JZQ7_SCLFO|nr:NUAK family SNF1-like kinase 1-like [Scleropages formosus]